MPGASREEGVAIASSPVALLRAAHLGPTLAVTGVTALLAVAERLPPGRGALVIAAVLAGQLVIGWSNDLLDADRDARVAREDKPLATGELSRSLVLASLALAAGLAVVLSAALGWRSGLTHLGLLVGSGIAYNLGLKATRWSFLPYLVAFGSLPAVVTLAAPDPRLPAAWLPAASAALGVAAHFLNTLPDLDDDVATGIRGLPHRIGRTRSRVVATSLLLAASVAAVVGPSGPPALWAWGALVVAAALALVALAGRGKAPFRAAMAIAVVDVTLLALVTR